MSNIISTCLKLKIMRIILSTHWLRTRVRTSKRYVIAGESGC